MLGAKSLAAATDRQPWGHCGTGLATAFSQDPRGSLCLVVCPEESHQRDRGRRKIPLHGKGKPTTCSRLAVRRDVGIKTFFRLGGRKEIISHGSSMVQVK